MTTRQIAGLVLLVAPAFVSGIWFFVLAVKDGLWDRRASMVALGVALWAAAVIYLLWEM